MNISSKGTFPPPYTVVPIQYSAFPNTIPPNDRILLILIATVFLFCFYKLLWKYLISNGIEILCQTEYRSSTKQRILLQWRESSSTMENIPCTQQSNMSRRTVLAESVTLTCSDRCLCIGIFLHPYPSSKAYSPGTSSLSQENEDFQNCQYSCQHN